MKVRIQIDTETFVRFWLVVIGFVFAIFMIYLSRTALIITGGAFFLALALSVPVNSIADRIPGRGRVGATAIAFVGLVAALGMFFTLVVPPIVQQTAKIFETAPQMLESFSGQWQTVGDFVERNNLQPQLDNAVASVRDNTEQWVKNLTTGVATGIGSMLSAIVAGIIMLVMAFLMLVEGPQWMERLWRLYRDKTKMERHQKLAKRMHDVVTGYVVGQLSVAGVGAAASGLIVFILSLFTEVPANLAIPSIAIAFVLALIPMFGSTLAGILIALLLVFNSLGAAVIFAIAYIIYQQIENNVISPAIQSRYIKLSPLAVLVAATIGIYLFGLIGGIISIPIAGAVKVLLQDYLEHSTKKRIESEKPLSKLVKKIQGESA